MRIKTENEPDKEKEREKGGGKKRDLNFLESKRMVDFNRKKMKVWNYSCSIISVEVKSQYQVVLLSKEKKDRTTNCWLFIRIERRIS